MNIKADRISISCGIDFGDPAEDRMVIAGFGVGSDGEFRIYNRIERSPTVITKPHKYADVIKAWADGKAIQYAYTPPTERDPLAQRAQEWLDFKANASPGFNNPHTEWRVKPKPAKWQKEREAFERGERVQWRSISPGCGSGWMNIPGLRDGPAAAFWSEPTNEFRIPHKWQEVLDAQERGEKIQLKSPTSDVWGDAHFKLTCNDGTTMYRIKPPAHKWQAEMDAQARGEKIEASFDGGKTWRQGNWFFDHTGAIYRIKPKPVTKRVRVALLGRSDGTVWPRAVFDNGVAAEVTKQPDFIRWVADWSEVELPKQKQSTTAAEIIARAEETTRAIFAGDFHTQDAQMREIEKHFTDCARTGTGVLRIDPWSLIR